MLTTHITQKTGKSRLSAPTVLLSGHDGPVYSARFHPEGNLVASAGHDKNILIWDISNNCKNIGRLKDHKNAVLKLAWSGDGDFLYSCGADKTAVLWDAMRMTKIKRINGHESIVNSIASKDKGVNLFVTGSNDKTAKLWDHRKQKAVTTFKHDHPVTSVAINSSSVATGGIEEDVRIWELRKPTLKRTLTGHRDTISSLSFCPNSDHLLSTGFDNSLRTWDLSPFSSKSSRMIRAFSVPMGGLEALLLKANWAADGSRICVGGSDSNVYVLDAITGDILYCLPGHKGVATEADLSPVEPILLSCGVDGKVFLGEL